MSEFRSPTRAATAATRQANESGDPEDHERAGNLHKIAAEHHQARAAQPKNEAERREARGLVSMHKQMAEKHFGAVASPSGGVKVPISGHAMQAGAKGGQFYVTATGRKVYSKG